MKPVFKTLAVLFFSGAMLIHGKSFSQSLDGINALKFASVAQFESAIDNYSAGSLTVINGYGSYQSMKSTFSEPQPPAGFDDPQPDDNYDVANDVLPDDSRNYSAYSVLSEIINTDKVVVIGNWIVKVDLANDRALVLNVNNAAQVRDLYNDNLANPSVLQFSLDDDGVEMLKGLDNGVPYSTLKLWCSDRYARGREDHKFFYNGNRHRLEAKVVYQRAFIIFSLEGKGKTQKRFLGIWWHDGKGNAFMKNIDLNFQTRCRDKGFAYYGDPCQYGCLPGYQSGSTCSYRPYIGTRALKTYLYAIDFQSTHGSGHVQIQD